MIGAVEVDKEKATFVFEVQVSVFVVGEVVVVALDVVGLDVPSSLLEVVGEGVFQPGEDAQVRGISVELDDVVLVIREEGVTLGSFAQVVEFLGEEGVELKQLFCGRQGKVVGGIGRGISEKRADAKALIGFKEEAIEVDDTA